MADHVFELSDASTVQNLMTKGGGPAVIDFWAAWCGPCRTMKPVYESVASDYQDSEVGFYSLDTEAHKDLARSFRVRSLPTLVFVDDGQIVDVVIGRIDGKRLGKKVDWLIRKSRGEGLLSRFASRLRRE
ncbi:MAG: thioredoxin family protein [Deltaproteobacteria bacterium]|nr:thioredoxin family protein [Deltaproteobacteria bacterium]